MKCKLFWYQGRNIEHAERGVNGWLEQQAKQCEVVQIHQSVAAGFMSPPTLVISVWYRERDKHVGS